VVLTTDGGIAFRNPTDEGEDLLSSGNLKKGVALLTGLSLYPAKAPWNWCAADKAVFIRRPMHKETTVNNNQ
jgi:hypothetical protein